MPLTYSISNGILLGMIAYVLMNLICGKFKKITIAMYILATLFVLKFIFINEDTFKKDKVKDNTEVVVEKNAVEEVAEQPTETDQPESTNVQLN